MFEPYCLPTLRSELTCFDQTFVWALLPSSSVLWTKKFEPNCLSTLLYELTRFARTSFWAWQPSIPALWTYLFRLTFCLSLTAFQPCFMNWPVSIKLLFKPDCLPTLLSDLFCCQNALESKVFLCVCIISGCSGSRGVSGNDNVFVLVNRLIKHPLFVLIQAHFIMIIKELRLLGTDRVCVGQTHVSPSQLGIGDMFS